MSPNKSPNKSLVKIENNTIRQRRALYTELKIHKTIYAWSTHFRDALIGLEREYDDVGFKDLDQHTDNPPHRNFAEPPIAMAYIK